MKGHVEKYLSKEDYVIQIWTTGKDEVIRELLDKDYKVIFSNYDAWYMDCGYAGWVTDGNNWCAPWKGWQAVYDNSPRQMYRDLGGERSKGMGEMGSVYVNKKTIARVSDPGRRGGDVVGAGGLRRGGPQAVPPGVRTRGAALV